MDNGLIPTILVQLALFDKMVLILVVVDNGLVRACFRSNNVLLCLVIILVSMEDGLVLNEFLKDLWHPASLNPCCSGR